jgi:hypothetical protein
MSIFSEKWEVSHPSWVEASAVVKEEVATTRPIISEELP